MVLETSSLSGEDDDDKSGVEGAIDRIVAGEFPHIYLFLILFLWYVSRWGFYVKMMGNSEWFGIVEMSPSPLCRLWLVTTEKIDRVVVGIMGKIRWVVMEDY